jgi:hypothetical protein
LISVRTGGPPWWSQTGVDRLFLKDIVTVASQLASEEPLARENREAFRIHHGHLFHAAQKENGAGQ